MSQMNLSVMVNYDTTYKEDKAGMNHKLKKAFMAFKKKPKNKTRRKELHRLFKQIDKEASIWAGLNKKLLFEISICILNHTKLHHAAQKDLNFLPLMIGWLWTSSMHLETAMGLFETKLIHKILNIYANNQDILSNEEFNKRIGFTCACLLHHRHTKNRLKELGDFQTIESKIDLENAKRRVEKQIFYRYDADTARKYVKDLVFTTCANCHIQETSEYQFKRCGKCKVVVYCSVECQTEHWETNHKHHCDSHT